VNLGILDRDEMHGVNDTLDAAALTYVAAFVASLRQLAAHPAHPEWIAPGRLIWLVCTLPPLAQAGEGFIF
jgi:hypothetical protein